MKRHFKSLRVKSGLTQTELANILGVAPKTVWSWENEEENKALKRASYETLEKVANVFGCKVDDIFLE